MYKSKSHNNIAKISKILAWFMSIFLLIWVSVSFELTPLNFLSQWVDKAQKDLEINSSKWNAVMKNLYATSLEQVQYSQINPILQSVKKTTQVLNNDYLCTINDNDTINILYSANTLLRDNIKNLSLNISKPSKNDMASSCSKLMSCVFQSNDATTIPESISYCKLVVNNYFTEIYANAYNISSLSEDNKWYDTFWNNSLEDSSYDVLYDIYNLSKILFDSVEEPSEILFYAMPNFQNNYQWNILTPTVIYDWFSPFYTVVDWSWDDEWWNAVWWNNSWYEPGNEWNLWQTNVIGDEDDDFWEFVQEVTYYVEWSAWSSFLGNDCLDWFEIQWYDGYSYTWIVTWNNSGNGSWDFAQYMENIISDIDNLSCNHNWICDSLESTTCSDCLPSGWWSSDVEEVQQILSQIGNDFDENTVSCFESCSSQPCTAMSCERLTCYAQCLCVSFESPWYEPLENLWLSSVFKLKFCMVPVTDGKLSNKKKVYNIATIFVEINNIVQNLRNSGELMINKKTKEYLEAWFMDNDFAKSFSVSVDSTTKETVSKWSEKQEMENQINLNTALMENILWFGKEMTVDWWERNKYMVLWSPEEGWLPYDEPITQTYESADTDLLVSSLQTEHLSSIDSEISEFLQSNLNFWMTTNDLFKSLNEIAESLKSKKN